VASTCLERIAYEELLADCCHYDGIMSLLKQHRPYFEALPSVRRPQESMVTIPLPNVRLREGEMVLGENDQPNPSLEEGIRYRVRQLPCDVALMMCDPEWKIKTGIEILLFIQRPGEDFSDLLGRWRQTQRVLGPGAEWIMPRRHKHLLAEGSETPHPLFVVFVSANGELSAQEDRMIRGLSGANLPVAIQAISPLPGNSTADELEADGEAYRTIYSTGAFETIQFADLGLDVELGIDGDVVLPVENDPPME
jgi:hypothetical protein